MATVYLAQDRRHDRRVAIKVVNPDLSHPLGAERFLREIETAAKLTHPRILPLHDSGEAGGALFYVMPYVDGETLRDRLRRERQLPLADALRIACEVASALDDAHRRDVLHRDIKPENILLEDGHAILADFGIARAIDAAADTGMTATGITLGTPTYMSPEQASAGILDGRSDVYSLACVLYEMLAGEPPFTGPTAQAVIARRLSAPPPRIGPYAHRCRSVSTRCCSGRSTARRRIVSPRRASSGTRWPPARNRNDLVTRRRRDGLSSRWAVQPCSSRLSPPDGRYASGRGLRR